MKFRLEEAGRVHRVGPSYPPKGAPEGREKARAFDKVSRFIDKRPDRSELGVRQVPREYYVGDSSNEGEHGYMVGVYASDIYTGDPKYKDYYGVNVVVMPNGDIDVVATDQHSRKQLAKDREKIIQVALDFIESQRLDLHSLHADPSVLIPKPPKKVKEMITFKQFILAEMKVKEPGWYVVDHMDKPVEGPMQERGAKELADEMNEKHAAKHGKGDITPYTAEYYTDYEIRRMNEGSDAKRMAKQDVEAILKVKAEIAKARKNGDKAALEKAKKKLAALTE